ncbi:hypothetical protein [Streptosporangium sp. H16]|uniref:hypothetical protein n=1 Tax=Streptosporangium sp. H16 TaxID=3444184 RepID=UPI003F797048
MASGQVSVWVPIAVAVLGIFGVITGQLVSAWREDRRWQRELAREDLRWEREQVREGDKRSHEAQLRWGEERLSVYVDFAKVMGEWKEILNEVETLEREGLQAASSLLDRQRDLNNEVALIVARISLVGSGFVQARCHDLWLFYESAYREQLEGNAALTAEGWKNDQYANEYYRVLEIIRDELGTPARSEGERPGYGSAALGLPPRRWRVSKNENQ